MLSEFKLGYNAAEATKNICYAKGEGAVDHSTVTRWFEKCCSGCKNLNKQASSGKPKTMNSEAILQAIEASLVGSTYRVSGKFIIVQSNVICHLHNLSTRSCRIVSHVPSKYNKIFDSFK